MPKSACKQNTFDDGKCPPSSPGCGSDPESLNFWQSKKTPRLADGARLGSMLTGDYIAVIACAIAIQRAPLTQTALATQVSIKDAANKRRSRLYHRIVHQDPVGPRLYSAAVKIKASNSPTFFCHAGQPHFSTEHRAAKPPPRKAAWFWWNQDLRAAVFTTLVATCAARRLRDRNSADQVNHFLCAQAVTRKHRQRGGDNIGPTAQARTKSLTGFPFARPSSTAGVQTVNWTRCSGSRDDF